MHQAGMDKHLWEEEGREDRLEQAGDAGSPGEWPCKGHTDCRGSRCDNRAGSLAEMKAERG